MGGQALISLFGLLLAIVGILGIAYAVFRSATVQKTLDLYRSENEALGKAVARLEGDYRTLAAKNEELLRANRVLKETVSGREAIQDLTRQLAGQHDALTRQHLALVSLLEEMKEQLAEMWRGVVDVLGGK